MKTDAPTKRISYSLALLVVALLFPYWVTGIAICAGFAMFPWYIEGIICAGLLDMMLSVPLLHFHGILVTGLLVSALLCMVIEGLKRLIRYAA